MRVTVAEAVARLPLPATAKWPLGVWDVELFRRGKVSLSYYAPRENDFQTAHDEDELYVVVTGTGRFSVGGQETAFGPGDVLFVPAKVPHRFEEFSADFGAWVIFF